jgi:hypothetical protein
VIADSAIIFLSTGTTEPICADVFGPEIRTIHHVSNAFMTVPAVVFDRALP